MTPHLIFEIEPSSILDINRIEVIRGAINETSACPERSQGFVCMCDTDAIHTKIANELEKEAIPQLPKANLTQAKPLAFAILTASMVTVMLLTGVSTYQ